MLLFLYIGCDATLSLPDSAGVFLEDTNNFSFTSEIFPKYPNRTKGRCNRSLEICPLTCWGTT